jgi:hypothetical protein
MKGQEEKKVEKEKNKTRREKLASFFFDIAKLSYAGLVLGTVVPLFNEDLQWSNFYPAYAGVFITVILVLIGNQILKY